MPEHTIIEKLLDKEGNPLIDEKTGDFIIKETVIATIEQPAEVTNTIVLVDLNDKKSIDDLIQKLTDFNK